MNEPSVGFVGGGRVARILLGGWKRARRRNADVIVSDPDAAVLERLRAEFPAVSITEDNLQAAKQDIVFLALHPPAFPTVLPQIRDSLSAHAVLVSLAPKWTMSRVGFERRFRHFRTRAERCQERQDPLPLGGRQLLREHDRVVALVDDRRGVGDDPAQPTETTEQSADPAKKR